MTRLHGYFSDEDRGRGGNEIFSLAWMLPYSRSWPQRGEVFGRG